MGVVLKSRSNRATRSMTSHVDGKDAISIRVRVAALKLVWYSGVCPNNRRGGVLANSEFETTEPLSCCVIN